MTEYYGNDPERYEFGDTTTARLGEIINHISKAKRAYKTIEIETAEGREDRLYLNSATQVILEHLKARKGDTLKLLRVPKYKGGGEWHILGIEHTTGTPGTQDQPPPQQWQS